ncbi:hypothetical protein CRG98_020899 [Punica granatum]|uniref:Uncharacterized protein n=1 Tax=Punica granatum TaxID=22663 RepID=A0A2I0JS52_PUNGR|nr:hypothetical protein CRG98_020899 [Punica granatum]
MLDNGTYGSMSVGSNSINRLASELLWVPNQNTGREVKGHRAPFPSTKPYQTYPLTASFGATKAPALVPPRSRGHGGGPGPSRRSHNPNPYYRTAAQDYLGDKVFQFVGDAQVHPDFGSFEFNQVVA